MIARIQLLRRAGVLLPPEHRAEAWSDEGYLETAESTAGTAAGRRLVLRALGAAPGHGLLHELFRPILVSIEHEMLRIRGVEPVATAFGTAAVVQEWLVRPRHC